MKNSMLLCAARDGRRSSCIQDWVVRGRFLEATRMGEPGADLGILCVRPFGKTNVSTFSRSACFLEGECEGAGNGSVTAVEKTAWYVRRCDVERSRIWRVKLDGRVPAGHKMVHGKCKRRRLGFSMVRRCGSLSRDMNSSQGAMSYSQRCGTVSYFTTSNGDWRAAFS